jgi:hypothetical protein
MYYLNMFLAFTILLTQQAYGALLIAMLFIGFYEIVVINKKYTYMKNFIERFY